MKKDAWDQESLRIFKQYSLDQYGFDLSHLEPTKGFIFSKKPKRKKFTARENRYKQEVVYSKGCAQCSKKIHLTIDHILPKALYRMFGMNGENKKDNQQKLCSTCNLAKGSKIDWKNEESKRLMEIFIKEVIDKHGLTI